MLLGSTEFRAFLWLFLWFIVITNLAPELDNYNTTPHLPSKHFKSQMKRMFCYFNTQLGFCNILETLLNEEITRTLGKWRCQAPAWVPMLSTGLAVGTDVPTPISLRDSLERSYTLVKKGWRKKLPPKSFSI